MQSEKFKMQNVNPLGFNFDFCNVLSGN